VNYCLGHVYTNLEQWDKALAYFNVCLANRYEFVFLYDWMADLFRGKGMPEKAGETIEDYLTNVADTSEGRRLLAYHYLTQGKTELARRELDRAVILDPTNWQNSSSAGDIALLDGDFVQAEKEFGPLLEEKEVGARAAGILGLSYQCLTQGKFARTEKLAARAIEMTRQAGDRTLEVAARSSLGRVYLRSGNPGKALDEYHNALALAVELDSLGIQRMIAFSRGLAYLDLKNIPEAEKAAEDLKAVNAKGMRKDVDIRIYDHLMGRIELEKRNYGGAIERLKKAVDSLPYGPLEKDAGYIDSLAMAYFRAGELDKARAEYERITALTTGRLGAGDIYAKSFYSLGKIFERTGDRVKARENYAKFLDLWKDADPGLPEPADARKRLAAL
jgi:tetratricopeptide (TPR) repeat protein